MSVIYLTLIWIQVEKENTQQVLKSVQVQINEEQESRMGNTIFSKYAPKNLIDF